MSLDFNHTFFYYVAETILDCLDRLFWTGLVPSPGSNPGIARSITPGEMPDNLSFVTAAGVRIHPSGSRLLAKIPQANVGLIIRIGVLGRLRCVGLGWSGLVIGRRPNCVQIEPQPVCANLT